MTLAVVDLLPVVLPRAAEALVDWLPAQRWFGAKGRPIDRVELMLAAEFADRVEWQGPYGVLAVAEVCFADSPTLERYQVPLGFRRTPADIDDSMIITTVDELAVYDATVDPELNSELLHLIGRNQVRGTVRFASEPRGELAFAHRNGLRARRTTAEQSNTSIIFGDRFILKMFRHLPDGPNPDLEMHRGLGRTGSQHVAPLLGAIEGEISGIQVTFGMLHSFAADSTDGWVLATGGLRGALCDADRSVASASFGGEARMLGNAVAAVHADLKKEFGCVEMTTGDLERLRDGLVAKLDDALDAVAALSPYADAVHTVFDQVATLPPGEPVHRVHGDLHLGQALRTPARWLLIDFEGEPALSRQQRVAWQSPLRDVAGMLRSFDYAAHHQLQVEDASEFCADATDRADQWAALADDEFCAGYAETAGRDPREHAVLLRAYELEKVIYETVYETRNRPDWVKIPLRALRMLVESGAGS